MTKQKYVKDILDRFLGYENVDITNGLAKIILCELGIDPYSEDKIVRIDWNKYEPKKDP